MSLQTLVINSDLSAAGFSSVCDLSPLQLPAANNFQNYISGLCGGNYMALLSFNVGVVAASGTITVASTGPTNTQTCLIAGYTLTAVTSGATPANGEFNISATAATVATGIAAAINAVVGLKTLVSASAALGVVTVTSASLGTPGNGVKFANGNLSNTTFSGSGFLASGSDGTAYSVDLR